MKKIFKKLYCLKSLNKLESYNLFKNILNNNITHIQLSSILTAIKVRKESIEEIIGAVQAFREHAITFDQPNYIFADIAGTGGDEMYTINISTMSAIVASSLGFKIIKHCNSGVSSKIGSSDILKKLKINIHLNPEHSKKILDDLNICFLFAPQYNSAFQNSIIVRKELKTKTIYNILGPLLNPANPELSIIGVYSTKLLLPMAKIIRNLNYKKAFIIHSGGTDEITLHHSTNVLEINNGKILSYILHPEDFGIKKIKKKFFINHDPELNYKICKNIFTKKGKIEYQYLIAVNTALLLKLFGYNDLKENTKLALNNIQNGKTYTHLNNIIKRTNLCKKIF